MERDRHGFILSGADVMRDDQPPRGWNLERDPFWLESSVPGIFVAGDVRHGSIKRIASAAGEGAMSVAFVHQHLAGPAAQRPGRSTVNVPAQRSFPSACNGSSRQPRSPGPRTRTAPASTSWPSLKTVA